MKRVEWLLALVVPLAGCGPGENVSLTESGGMAGGAIGSASRSSPSVPARLAPVAPPAAVASTAAAKPSLTEFRRTFRTKLAGEAPEPEPPDVPPPSVFSLIRYDSPAGKLAAYLTPDPGDGRKHAAIVWITGGDCNSIGDVWNDAPRDNDQTAAAFRKSGIVMMFPSLRGGNDNPGRKEGFLGEVDDVLAAIEHVGRLKYVDPKRVYLGGHSTGGTLVMLVAASTDRLRAAFAFGPVHDVRYYPPVFLPFDTSNPKEFEPRSPIRWLDSVRSPLFVLEGSGGNFAALQLMQRTSRNPLIHFHVVQGVNHFEILASANELLAAKVLADDGPTTRITLTPAELAQIDRN